MRAWLVIIYKQHFAMASCERKRAWVCVCVSVCECVIVNSALYIFHNQRVKLKLMHQNCAANGDRDNNNKNNNSDMQHGIPWSLPHVAQVAQNILTQMEWSQKTHSTLAAAHARYMMIFWPARVKSQRNVTTYLICIRSVFQKSIWRYQNCIVVWRKLI